MADLPLSSYFESKYVYFNFVYVAFKSCIKESAIDEIREMTISFIRHNHPDFFIDFAPSFYDEEK